MQLPCDDPVMPEPTLMSSRLLEDGNAGCRLRTRMQVSVNAVIRSRAAAPAPIEATGITVFDDAFVEVSETSDSGEISVGRALPVLAMDVGCSWDAAGGLLLLGSKVLSVRFVG